MRFPLARIGTVALAAALLAAPAQPQEVFEEIDQILGTLSEITGLKPLSTVRYDNIGRDKLKQFLEERIKEEVKPEEIWAEELTLKKFGMVPQDYDLKKSTIDLLTEQAAAFYDFRKKKLFLLDSYSPVLRRLALVHELAHALADQHFRLEKYIEHAGENDDGGLARMAVMEGQASWLMTEYTLRKAGQSLKKFPEALSNTAQMMDAASGQFPELDKAPLYIRETLLFPYTEGMLFQQRVVEKLDQAAFTEVFRRPPASTQQILHPEKYLDKVEPVPCEPPRPTPARGYRKLAEGSLGELDESILLRQYVSEDVAKSLAPRWRGGAYRLLERKSDKRLVLAHTTAWEDAAAAHEYLRTYPRVLEGKWKTLEKLVETDDELAGRGDDGFFRLRVEGVRVQCLEGLASLAETGATAAAVNSN